MATKAESRKEESNGARNAAKKQKIPTLRRRSNRTGRSIRYRTQPAPISASHALLTTQRPQRADQKIERRFALSLTANQVLLAQVAWPKFSSLQCAASHGRRSRLPPSCLYPARR